MDLSSLDVACIAGGYVEDHRWLARRLKESAFLICADGGLEHCRKAGLYPDLLIGDMDSLGERHLDLFASLPKRCYPSAKDQSDLEIALELALEGDAASVTLYGAIGLRLDHALANLLLALRHPNGRVRIETEREIAYFVTEKASIDAEVGQTLSLLPLTGECSGVTTQGLMWELEEATLSATFFSLSNVCVAAPFTVEVKQGCVLCCLCKQR